MLVKDLKSQAIDLQDSEDEEPSCALAILIGTAKSDNSMFSTVDGKNTTYLLNILGLVTLAHHSISQIRLLPYIMWTVSLSMVKAIGIVCRKQRKENCVAI